MSGWRVFALAAAKAHPEAIDSREWHHSDVKTAIGFGLVERAGRVDSTKGTATPTTYRATEAGLLYATGRIAVVPKPDAVGHGRRPNTLAATWLRALPEGVRMDLRQPRADASEWMGL